MLIPASCYGVCMKKGAIPKKQLEALLLSDLSLRKIASRLGRTTANVRYWIKKYGIKPRQEERPKGWVPPPTDPKTWSTNQKGDVALGQAVAWFLTRGCCISLPLTESQSYDLVVDDGARLYRVEVKFTGVKDHHNYSVSVSSSNLTSTGSVMRPFDSSKVDLLFVTTADLDLYVIPSSEVGGAREICLGPKYARCRVFMDRQSGQEPELGC